jgi:nucleotide-binding universal stress UspA family protein
VKVSPQVVVDWKRAADVIVEYAETHEADLIALATRRGGRFSRLFGGSVVDRVVRRTSTPVLFVKATDTRDVAEKNVVAES